jgi:trimeric autotransporter adhesin
MPQPDLPANCSCVLSLSAFCFRSLEQELLFGLRVPNATWNLLSRIVLEQGRIIVKFVLSVIAGLLLFPFLNAQQRDPQSSGTVPRLVTYSGKALDEQGKPISGITGVSFAIYRDEFEDAPLWMETQNATPDADGNYTVQLGATSPNGLPFELFSSAEARWLGVRVNGGSEQPRVLLLSVPYALKAADAQTLGGYPASAFLLATPSATASILGSSRAMPPLAPPASTPVTTGGGAPNALAKFDGRSDIVISQVFDTGTNVGIGTNKPTVKLEVNGATTVRGPLLLASSGPATATAGRVSQPQRFNASSFNSSTSSAVTQTFQWQAEPTGNNTATPSATMSLLFKSEDPTPAETGLSISSEGIIQFAPGQTFPNGSGSGTVTSVGLSAPDSDFSVSGSPVTSNGKLNLQWLVPPSDQNVPNAIVKRDAFGNFNAATISATTGMNSALFSAANSNPVNFFLSPIVGVNSASGDVEGIGVAGVSDSQRGAGVFGRNTGGGPAVLGETGAALSGQGVRGESFATQNSLNGFGPDGVDGISHSPLGSGVAAVNDSGGDGLFAQSSGGFAAFFLGDVDVDGNLSKAGGSFKIDHPLDPANKYLYHSFVESPDMMNVYNGNVVTDGQGRAVVQMPEWFEALNRDFRYQLTPIGQFAQAMVAGKMANNSFIIQTDKPNVEVSWQVTGVRHDAWADANRIPVEQLKSSKERGLYLHPELFGAPAEMSIAASRHAIAAEVQKGKFRGRPATAREQR